MLSVKKATKFAVANLIIVSTVFSSVTPAIAQSDKSSKDESFAVGNTKNPKNVIFLVGDGMGLTQLIVIIKMIRMLKK